MANTDKLPSGKNAEELIETWQQLSMLTHKARRTPYPTQTNDILREHADANADKAGLLAPTLLLWIGDNFMYEARYREALEAYTALQARYPDASAGGMPLIPHVLEQTALCHERMGNAEEASNVYSKLVERPRGKTSQGEISEAWLHYQVGRIAEEMGKDEEAIAAYGRAAKADDEPKTTTVSMPELARRSQNRLQSSRSWMRARPEQLASLITRALERKDIDALEGLASPTHFTLAAICSERHFVALEKVLPILKADLAQSDVHADPTKIIGSGSKLYLESRGWQGKFLRGYVFFIFTQARDGWEWSGLALAQFPEEWEETLGKVPKEENQPLDLTIKAPWPAGEEFQAGGLPAFVVQAAIFAGTLFGLGALAALAASLASSCGWGPPGFYYNEGSTHQGNDAFAIDFTRYQRGVPLLNIAGNTPVLAIANGVVQSLRQHVPTGDSSIDNNVVLTHLTFADALQILMGNKVQPRYTSKYLHLAGPGLIPVSVGMFVPQGGRLGLVDDTGFSAFSHLHFSIHDRDLGQRSVRPTPMDGQTLNDSDKGRCVHSTNIEV